MVKDAYSEEIQDKMNHGVSRLSPVGSKLYFMLTGAFLSLGSKNTIKTALSNLIKDLGIAESHEDNAKTLIINAFQDIHTNTFVKYKFDFKTSSNNDQLELHISRIDNKEELKAIIERSAINKMDMS